MRIGLLAIVVLGGGARLAWAWRTAEPPSGLHDPAFYLMLASMLAAGRGYAYLGPEGGVTAYYPPGYPALVAAAIWLTDRLPLLEPSDFAVAVALNVALSTATIALVFALARRLVDVRVGLAAAALVAAWPNLIFHSGVVLTETLFLSLMLGMLLVVLATPEAASAPGRGRLVAAGLLFGAAGMVRPTFFVAAPLFLALWWPAGARQALRRTAWVGAATLAVVLPWTVRNAVQMRAPILISTNFGDNFCMGHGPEATGAFSMSRACFGNLERGPRPESETRRQAEMFRRAWRFIRASPAHVFTRMPAKLRYTLDGDADGLEAAADYGGRELFSPRAVRALERVAHGYYAAMMLAALAGALGFLRGDDRARRRTFFVAISLVQLVPPLLTFGNARFKLPIVPAVALCAATALVTLGRRRARAGSPPRRPRRSANPDTPRSS